FHLSRRQNNRALDLPLCRLRDPVESLSLTPPVPRAPKPECPRVPVVHAVCRATPAIHHSRELLRRDIGEDLLVQGLQEPHRAFIGLPRDVLDIRSEEPHLGGRLERAGFLSPIEPLPKLPSGVG